MNKYLFSTLLLTYIMACSNQSTEPRQETDVKTDMLLHYMSDVHKQKLDSSLTYCIIYMAENCSKCNAPSEPIIDSILHKTKDRNRIIITTKKEHARAIFYQKNSRVLIDSANMLERYGIVYPRHMLNIYHKHKLIDEIEIIPAKANYIDSIINSHSKL